MMRNPNLWSVFSNSEKFFFKEDRFGGFKKNHSEEKKVVPIVPESDSDSTNVKVRR